MEDSKNKISIIIPTYNRAKYITEAIDSVLQQTYTNIEIIVIDDGSTDNTKELVYDKYNNIISDNKLKYIYHSNHGIAYSRNTGINNATGEYIAFIDSDDIWVADKLETQLNFLLGNPNCDIVTAQYDNFVSPKDVVTEKMRTLLFEKKPKIYFASALCHKKVFQSYGLLDTQLETSEDVEWITRAILLGCQVMTVEKVLYLRRVHNSNVTTINPVYDIVDTYKNIFNRLNINIAESIEALKKDE